MASTKEEAATSLSRRSIESGFTLNNKLSMQMKQPYPGDTI